MSSTFVREPVPHLVSFSISPEDLDTRRRIQDSAFLMKLVNVVVCYPELLLELSFHLPGRTVSQDMLVRLQYSTMYQERIDLSRLMLPRQRYSVDPV
ncbi:hypothetical protein J6590_098562 [Homalodisca vitripennis]|nr:hypothetical protein J6590_098562 [Homalodisca vitripennis]